MSKTMLEEKKRYSIDFDDIPAERAHMPELPAQDRITHFEEIEKGFSPEQARREAERCLSCRRCLGCKLCLAACEKEAILVSLKNLMTFPWVRERVNRGQLSLHGWYYNIGTGQLRCYNQLTGEFEILVERYSPATAEKQAG